jgi:hypothetical protein
VLPWRVVSFRRPDLQWLAASFIFSIGASVMCWQCGTFYRQLPRSFWRQVTDPCLGL